MADPGPRYRSLTASALGADAVRTIVTSTLRAHSGFEVHELAPDRLLASRARRPPWALGACLATIWLGGLGLLFLLVTRTESGEITVVDGPRGCTVTLPPVLGAGAVAAVERALRPTAEVVPPPATTDGPPVADDLDGRTVSRDGSADRPSGPPTEPPHAVLRFPGGPVVVEVGRPVVLGRDPSARGDAEARPVPGDATTVSKSHLLVAFDGVTATVEDLGSTNGTAIERDGSVRPLAAGTPTALLAGDRVRLGSLVGELDLRPRAAEVHAAWS